MQTHVLRLIFALFLVYFPTCHAILVNRTIDSNYGDPITGFVPTYLSPTPIWGDQTCPAWDPKASTGCTIQPDTAKAFDGTWKATTYLPADKNINFTLNFVGIAIFVYFILANLNAEGDPYTNTNVNFTLDGAHAGNYSHEPDNNTYALVYNATVFSRTDLTMAPHTLVVSVNDYDRITFVCFDWAMYTADLPDSNATATGSLLSTASSTAASGSSSSSSSNNNTGAIVGGVIGGLALIGIVVAALLWRRKRQSHQLQKNEFQTSPTPFLSIPSKAIPPSTAEATTSSVSFAAGRSREALNPPHRRDVSAATGKRAEAGYPPTSTTISRSTEPVAAESAGSSGSSASPEPEHVANIASLSGQMQELRSQMEQLQTRRESTGAPPAYA